MRRIREDTNQMRQNHVHLHKPGNVYTIQPKVCGHLTIIPIGGPSPNCCWNSNCTPGLLAEHRFRTSLMLLWSIKHKSPLSCSKVQWKVFPEDSKLYNSISTDWKCPYPLTIIRRFRTGNKCILPHNDEDGYRVKRFFKNLKFAKDGRILGSPSFQIYNWTACPCQ